MGLELESGLVLVRVMVRAIEPATPGPPHKDQCSCGLSTVTAAARVATTAVLAAAAGPTAVATAAAYSAAAAAPAGGQLAAPAGSEAAAGPAASLVAAAEADRWLGLGLGWG